MKNQRFGKFVLSLGVVLSLLASSLSICACSHHAENKTSETSCHEHSSPMSMELPDASHQAENSQNFFCVNEFCNCAAPAPKVFSKAELVKIEKQTAEIFAPVVVEFVAFSETTKANVTDFSKPFYLSDSFYNLKSPRAPPRS